MKQRIVCVIGPTASGKSAKAIELAKERDGEVISVDSRQVYRTLDIGTEKVSIEEMQGIPHHLIDIREPEEVYSAGDFVRDTSKLIDQLTARGKVPVLAGGTHFYFDALLYGLPEGATNFAFRETLASKPTEELYEMLRAKDPVRAENIDRYNPRRLIRALELLEFNQVIQPRIRIDPQYIVEWIIVNVPRDELRSRIDERLKRTVARGLIDEVRTVRSRVGDVRLNELGLEYKVVGEYLRGERSEESLIPSLFIKLWHYARKQKAWIKKLEQAR